jgi:PilZ domain
MDNQFGSISLSAAPFSVQSSMNALQANRRRHPRYPCEGRAEVFVPHGALLFQGRILDLSLSGCFIETLTLNLERGTHVEVFFVAGQMQFRIAGHIAVLHRKRGAGIAFQSLSPRRARQVADLVHELQEASGFSSVE